MSKDAEISAIPTIYRGVEMKSRFEAQCACLFDKLGWEWVYEIQSYSFSNGISYRPDFFLPGLGVYWECRGYDSAKGEAQIKTFAEAMKEGVFVPDWYTCFEFAVLHGDGTSCLYVRELKADRLVAVHCTCGWFLSTPQDDYMQVPCVWCPCCGTCGRVDSVIVISAAKGKVTVNGVPVEVWIS